eukprot:m.60566 g.60566  ORF g.60566 m.60566 type:complete len:455 (-) comp7037_c1_seq1:1153-2517(-)
MILPGHPGRSGHRAPGSGSNDTASNKLDRSGSQSLAPTPLQRAPAVDDVSLARPGPHCVLAEEHVAQELRGRGHGAQPRVPVLDEAQMGACADGALGVGDAHGVRQRALTVPQVARHEAARKARNLLWDPRAAAGAAGRPAQRIQHKVQVVFVVLCGHDAEVVERVILRFARACNTNGIPTRRGEGLPGILFVVGVGLYQHFTIILDRDDLVPCVQGGAIVEHVDDRAFGPRLARNLAQAQGQARRAGDILAHNGFNGVPRDVQHTHAACKIVLGLTVLQRAAMTEDLKHPRAAGLRFHRPCPVDALAQQAVAGDAQRDLALADVRHAPQRRRRDRHRDILQVVLVLDEPGNKTAQLELDGIPTVVLLQLFDLGVAKVRVIRHRKVKVGEPDMEPVVRDPVGAIAGAERRVRGGDGCILQRGVDGALHDQRPVTRGGPLEGERARHGDAHVAER